MSNKLTTKDTAAAPVKKPSFLKRIFKKVAGTVSDLRSVLFLLHPIWRHCPGVIIYALFFRIVVMPLQTVLSVTLVQSVINEMARDGSTLGSTMRIALLYSAAIFAISAVEQTGSNICAIFLTKMRVKTRREIFERAYKTDYRYFDDPKYFQDYTFAATEYINKVDDAYNRFRLILQAVSTIFAMSALIAMVGPLVIPLVLVITVLVSVVNMIGNKVYMKYEEVIKKQERKIDYINRTFYTRGAAQDLRATNLGEEMLEKYDEVGKERVGTSVRSNIRMYPIWLTSSVLWGIAESLIMIYIIYQFFHGTIERIGDLAGVFAAATTLHSEFSYISYLISDSHRLKLYADRIKKFFGTKSVIETNAGELVPPDGNMTVEFSHVSFGYEGSEFALRDLNFKIRAGEKIAVVGENGAGKTTMTKLLLRLYDTSDGEIRINGRPIAEYNLSRLRLKIGVAPQTPNIYAASLRDNLTIYGSADDARLLSAIDECRLQPILEKSNGTLDSELTREFDEKGIMLSGGEAQKIAIARLFSGEFGLLILDEPSSALDPLAEYAMTELLFGRANTTTTIMIAHRLSTVRNADRIIVVENGAVIESGTHDELIRLSGKYAEMWEKQSENYMAG